MTILTAAIIQGSDQVFASSYGPIDGKYGIYIGTLDETPSGCSRPRDLLTSEPFYATAGEAADVGNKVIEEVRRMEL